MIEYWVMRIVSEEEHSRAGSAVQLVNGDLCVPIACYTEEGRARERMASEVAATGLAHKVTMSADLNDL